MIQRWISYLKKTPYVIAIGKPDLEKPFEFDEDTRILFIKCLDNYDSLSSKVYGANNYFAWHDIKCHSVPKC